MGCCQRSGRQDWRWMEGAILKENQEPLINRWSECLHRTFEITSTTQNNTARLHPPLRSSMLLPSHIGV